MSQQTPQGYTQPSYMPAPPIFTPLPQPMWYKLTIWLSLIIGAILIVGLLAWIGLAPGYSSTSLSVGGLAANLPGTNWRPLEIDVNDTPGWARYAWQGNNGEYLFAVSLRSSEGTISSLTADVLKSDNGVAWNCSATAPTCVQSPAVWHGLPATRLETQGDPAAAAPDAGHTLAYIFQSGGFDYYVQVTATNKIWTHGGDATAKDILDSTYSTITR